MCTKKVLIMCTKNSCRSIIAEALVNKFLDGIKAFSCGTKSSGKVNANAKKVLEQKGIWSKEYYSKHLDEIVDIEFDLIVTVCANADDTCPSYPYGVKKIHLEFEDPDGKEFEEFVKTYNLIKENLLPKIKMILKC